MKHMKWITLSVLVILALVLAACGSGGQQAEAPGAAEAPAKEPVEELVCNDDIGCVEIGPDEPIHIAYMLTTSGATAFLGEDSKGGIEIAIDDRGGELLGHPIELTGEDSLCNAEGGQTAAQKVASDPTVTGVIGTNCSSAATAALPIISNAGLVMGSPSNTAPSLTAPPEEGGVWMPGYYRTAHNDLFQGKVAADFAWNELGARKVATIHDGSPYAESLQQVFADRIKELGGEVTFQGAVNVGDTDMRPILQEIAANPPDVLYFPIFEPEGPLIVAQAAEVAGLEDTILMGADGLLVESFPENAGSNAIGMYLSGPYITGPKYEELLAKWEAKFGGSPPSGFHAHAYDATNILLDAIEKVAQVDAEGSILIGRQALRDAIYSTKDYPGVTGTLTCNQYGDCATGEALGIFQITEAEVNEDNWPPPVVWTPSTGKLGEGEMAEEAMGPMKVSDADFVCNDDIGCVEVASDEPIHIAYMLTTSGATAFLGEDSKGGIEIAIDDRGGELLGHPIELTGEDSLCNAEGGQTAAQKVASDPTVTGVIGTNCSSAATAALPIISNAGLVMGSPSNTAPSLTAPPEEGGVWMPGYYRTAHNDLFQGKVAADFAWNELGARKVATIHDGSPYAESLQQVFADRIKELGGEVTFQGAVNVGDTDMRPILQEIAANPPDVLYFPIFEPEGPLIVAQAAEVAGLEDTILMGADGLLVESFPENAGSNAIGMYLSGPYITGPKYEELLAKWEAKFGGSPPSGFHAHAYDATNILLDAIEKVAQVDAEGSILIGRQALRDAIYSTKDYPGVTGTLTCNQYGDCATGEALGIFQITEAEVNEDNWPPPVVWTPSGQ